MSSQKGGMLQMSQSCNFNTDANYNYRVRPINPSNFYSWHKDNLYKSSYAKFHSSSSVQPKNKAIPGYGGFVPGLKSENLHGKSFTYITKQSFKNQNLGKNLNGLATTGFNVNKEVFVDKSKLASSSKYGKSSIQKSHPNWNTSSWCSTTKAAFRNPNDQANPTYRPTDKFLQNNKQKTKRSGFGMSNSLCDGEGTVPDQSLKGDNKKTQYRDRYNKQKPRQRSSSLSSRTISVIEEEGKCQQKTIVEIHQ